MNDDDLPTAEDVRGIIPINPTKKLVAPRITVGEWAAVNIGTDGEPMMSVVAKLVASSRTHEVAICATGDSSQEMENINARFLAGSKQAARAAAELIAVMDTYYGNDSLALAEIETLRAALLASGYSEKEE